MENVDKKSLLGYYVKNEELYKIANIIANKALRIIETKGNKYASNIIEHKQNQKKDDFEDIIQNIIEQIILNNYIVTKEAFRVVNAYINNIEKSPTIKTIVKDENGKPKTTYIKMEKISLDDEGEETADLLNYISYLSYNDNKIMIENAPQKENTKNIIDALDLTPKQTEILDIFSKTYNATKTAELLGISRQRVQNIINDIRKKLVTLNIQIA